MKPLEFYFWCALFFCGVLMRVDVDFLAGVFAR
jgi:hypothetical protein